MDVWKMEMRLIHKIQVDPPERKDPIGDMNVFEISSQSNSLTQRRCLFLPIGVSIQYMTDYSEA